MSKRAGKLSRGIRNNNPGNIEYNKRVDWQGQIGTDGRFIRFKAPEYGIRAIVRILQTYQRKHKLRSIQAMINRWAPSFENDTRAYINAVAAKVGVKPNAPVDLSDANITRALVRAIIMHENGAQYEHYYTDQVIDRGLGLAGLVIESPDTAAKSILTSKRSAAATVGAGATIAGAASAMNDIKQALDNVQTVSATAHDVVVQLQDAQRVIWLLAAVAIGAFATVIWTKYHDKRRGR